MYRRALGKLPIALAGIAFFAVSPAGTLRAQELVRVEATRFSAPPPVMVVAGSAKCNPEGDLHLIYSDAPPAVVNEAGGIEKLPIRRFPNGSGTAIEYPVPTIPGYLDVLRRDFDLSPHGQLYALLAGVRGRNPQTGAAASDYLIAKYSADGTVASYVKLADVHGKDSEPIRLGAFAGGRFLVAGMLFGERQGRAFAAVFGSDGNLVSQLPVPDDITPSPFDQGGPPPNPDLNRHPMPAIMAISHTLIAGAPDGNAYLLWGTLPQRLYIVSPDGNVTKQFEVPAPHPGMRALRIGPAGPGKIFLAFDPGRFVPSNERGARPLTVLDASTGQATAGYEGVQGEDSQAIPACASSPHDFLFVRPSEDRKNLLVVHYSAPGVQIR